MNDESAVKSTIQLNLLSASIFFVGLVLLAQMVIDLTRRPLGEDSPRTRPAITVSGFREQAEGGNYDTFTIFENDGSVHAYWREGDAWKARPLPHYK